MFIVSQLKLKLTRQSNYKSLIIGPIEYLKREWKLLQNLPKVSVFDGSALVRRDMRALNINHCDMCIILSAKVLSETSDQVLDDKEAILACLNIKGVIFQLQDLKTLSL